MGSDLCEEFIPLDTVYHVKQRLSFKLDVSLLLYNLVPCLSVVLGWGIQRVRAVYISALMKECDGRALFRATVQDLVVCSAGCYFVGVGISGRCW